MRVAKALLESRIYDELEYFKDPYYISSTKLLRTKIGLEIDT